MHPTYHCYWCRSRVVGERAWIEHTKRCKADDELFKLLDLTTR